jgi:hypothetical protein
LCTLHGSGLKPSRPIAASATCFNSLFWHRFRRKPAATFRRDALTLEARDPNGPAFHRAVADSGDCRNGAGNSGIAGPVGECHGTCFRNRDSYAAASALESDYLLKIHDETKLSMQEIDN